MWLLFALIGLLLGKTSGGLAGALLGGLLGYLLGRVNRLEARLRSLEAGRGNVPAVRASSPAVEAPAAIAPAAAVPDPAPVPATVTVPGIAPAPDRSTPPWLGAPPRLAMPTELLGRLLSGNILAKLGMVLLFFGIASALKLAADYGMLPPYLRLLAAALAGLASLWAGAAPATGQAFRPAWLYRFAPESEQARRGFGFALEGGGFGILYIATWFALAQFGYLGTATAFLIFAGLGAACLAMAARQDSQSFALLGVLGGFLAPLLVPGQGEHRILFAYLALLDLYILALSLHRAWRLVIVTSLAFSVGVGYAWADLNYAAALRVDVESFVLVVFLLYSATPWLAARRGPPPQWGWQSGVLLFGPPAAAAATQSALYYGDLDFLALSSLGAGLWYALLQRLTRPTGAMLVRQAQAGLALAFLSLAPWLAFSQNVAGVFWALEGAGVVWYASRSGTRLPLLAGSLLQALSGLLLLDLWWQGPDGLPFRDSLFHASLLLVAAGALSAYAVRAQAFRHRAFLVWALVWWFGAFLAEFERLFDPARTWVAMAALATLSSAGLEWLGRRHGLADLRRAALLLLPVLALALANAYLVTGHPLAHGLWLVGAAALAVHYRGLYRQAGDGLTWWLRERHVAAYWLAAWALAWEAAWLAEPAFGASTAEAARAAVLAGTLLLVCRGATVWPFAGALRPLYLDTALALPALLGWLWLFAMPTGLTGAWALPYLPLVNPLEAAAALLLWALYGHWLAAARFGPRLAYPALFGLAALFWFSQMLARTVHHWAGVPFLAGPLWHSALLQALLSLGWTAFALFAMVAASSRQIRPLWFAGLGLLLLVCAKLAVVDLANVAGLLRVLSLLGVGLLVLGAGYLAPVPPRQAEPAPPAG